MQKKVSPGYSTASTFTLNWSRICFKMAKDMPKSSWNTTACRVSDSLRKVISPLSYQILLGHLWFFLMFYSLYTSNVACISVWIYIYIHIVSLSAMLGDLLTKGSRHICGSLQLHRRVSPKTNGWGTWKWPLASKEKHLQDFTNHQFFGFNMLIFGGVCKTYMHENETTPPCN